MQQPMAESSKPGALEFVSNEFNATSFYGLDDEEEEEQQQQQPPESQEPQLPQNNGKSTIRKDDYSSPHGIETNENDAVSGNQLLALFGAAPPTKHAAVPDTNGDSQDPFLVFATADSDQPKNSSSKDAGHSTSLDEHQHSRVAFTLPPASQSSSSSEEEDAFSQEG